LRTTSIKRVLYTPVFHTRRILIVFSNIVFSKNVILTGYERDHPFQKIASFLIIQILYLVYIIESMPHQEKTFNRLEIINELSMVFLGYVMIGVVYEAIHQDSAVQSFLVFSTFVIGVLIFIVNFSVMINKSIQKIKMRIKHKKLLKEH